MGRKSFEHVFGIGLPIGRKVQYAARGHPGGKQVQKSPLHQPPLMVALLGPRVRKINSQAGNTVFRQPVAKEFHGVTHGDSNIVDPPVIKNLQKMPDARLVNLDPEEILLRFGLRHAPGRFPVSESDFHDQRCWASEQEINLNVPVVLTATQARQIAEVALHEIAITRNLREIRVSSKHLQVDPTDVIEVEEFR